MKQVLFDRLHGKESAVSGDVNTIYFTTDTHEVFVNGVSYGKADSCIKWEDEDD